MTAAVTPPQTAPATEGAPVAAPAPAAAAEPQGGRRIQNVRSTAPAGGVVKRVYGTQADAGDPGAAQAAADASRAARAAAATPPVPGVATAQQAGAPPPPVVDPAKPKADAAEPALVVAPPFSADGETKPEAEAVPADGAISDKDYAARVAKIHRAQKRLDDDKQSFSKLQEQHKVALQRVDQVEQAAKIAQRDPVGFMSRVFGVSPQQLVDALVAQHGGGQSPQLPNQQQGPTPAELRVADLERKLADYGKQIEESVESTKKQQAMAAETDYIRHTVSPMLADESKFAFIRAEFGGEAAAQVYRTMEFNYKAQLKSNPRAIPPSPQKVAEFIEGELRKKASLLTKLLPGGAGPTQSASPSQVATPTASSEKVAAQNAPAVGRRSQLSAPAYTSKPRFQ